MSTKKDRISEIEKELASTKSTAVKRALELEKQRIEDEQVTEVQSFLKTARGNTERAVEMLRIYREREKRQRKVVLALDAAYIKYTEDGDKDAYVKVAQKLVPESYSIIQFN